jgi:V8-like Glu-specific endopeptidase
LARTPDTSYRDVGDFSSLMNRNNNGQGKYCTGTAISDTVVIAAAHCGRLVNTGQVPGVDDERPYSVARQAQTLFTIDLDGDDRTSTDQYSYTVGRRYTVLTKVDQPTGAAVVPMDSNNSGS